MPPDVADLAPSDPVLTACSMPMRKVPTWREVARIVLHIDPNRELDRARQAFDSHLARAKWMRQEGYRHLLRRGWPRADA